MKILSQINVTTASGSPPMQVNRNTKVSNLNSQYSNELANQNGTTFLKLWKGLQTEYDAIVTKDPDTIYFIVEV